MKRWDILEDMVICSHVIDGDINNKKVVKALCKEFNITASQLSARANNFKHIVNGKTSFWHTSRQEREAFRLLIKHNTLVL